MAQERLEIPSSSSSSLFKSSNILKLLTNHQNGLLKKLSFESQVTKLKVGQLKPSVEEFEIDPDISFCKFVRPSDTGCLIGIWQKNMDPASKHSSVYRLNFEYSQQHYLSNDCESCPIISDLSCSGPFFKRMDVTDTCERNIKDKSFLLYVGNTAVSGGRIVLNFTDFNSESSTSGLSEIIWRSTKCVWSCASNAFTERFAAGTEKGCFIFDMLNFMEVEHMQSDVLAVEFRKDGQLLYCGREKDELIQYDMRQDSWVSVDCHFCNRPGLNGIKEIKLLSDENSMIVCGTDGTMWRMDLRMKRPVFQYPGFLNKLDRRPVSVDEGLDLLCATGDDNCSRIWSLHSGDLLKTIHPFDQSGTNSHACLVAEQRRWFVAVVQGNTLTPVLHY